MAGSRVRTPVFNLHDLSQARDLIRCTRADGTTGRGGSSPPPAVCTPYFTRAEIADGALATPPRDRVGLLIVSSCSSCHIQVSGPNQAARRQRDAIGYDEQNGREYVFRSVV